MDKQARSTRAFVWANLVSAGVFFASSCLLLLSLDWRPRGLAPPGQPLALRLATEPRVVLYFFICFASLTWLVGFFALGLVHFPSPGSTTMSSPATIAPMMAPKRGTGTTPREQPPVARKQVAVLGGTGLVGRALAIRLDGGNKAHPTLRLGFLVGSPDTAGKMVRDVWERKEAILHKQYGDMWVPMVMPPALANERVASFEDVFAANPADIVVISCVAPALGWMEDRLIASGFNVFSISPHARTRPGVPLVVPEVNGPREFRSLLLRGGVAPSSGFLIKSPNCVSCGSCLVLDALAKTYGGLVEVSLTTFQSLSGRGDALYPTELVVGNVLPLGRTEEDTNRKVREEVIRVLDNPELRISVTAQRVYTQRGHYVDVRVKTRLPVPSEHHVALALERYAPFAGTPFANLPDAPKRGPIRVSLEPKWPRPVQAVSLGGAEDDGMTVHVGHISTDDLVFDLSLSFVVDNVARGAYGAALLMAEVFEQVKVESQS